MTTTTTEKQSPTVTIQCQFCQTWNRIDATRAADALHLPGQAVLSEALFRLGEWVARHGVDAPGVDRRAQVVER